MKKAVFGVTIVFLACSSALGFDYMGPPTAQVKGAEMDIENPPGQLAFAVDYMYSKMDLELEDVDIDIDDVKLHKAYFRPSYGVPEGFEIYGLLGAAKAETSDDELGDSDTGFAGGLGARVTLWKQDNWSWGLLGQFTGTKLENFDAAENIGDDVDMILFEVEIATGPVWQVSDAVSLYGGPFVHLVYGELEGSVTVAGNEFSGSLDLDQNDPVGGFIGTQIKLTKNLSASAEFQATGAGYGIGGQLAWTF